MGLFDNTCRPVTDHADRALTLSLPPPSPQEKNQQPIQKCLPIKLPIDPIGKPPSVNPVYRTHT